MIKIRDYHSENPINGIYKIENKINNRVYIGRSDDIEARWNEHRKDLKKKKHSNKELQNDWNIYGKDSFKFEIIEVCSFAERKYKELYYFFQFENIYNKVSKKEKYIYELCNLLNELKLNYQFLTYKYQCTTNYKDNSLLWDLLVKYNKKTVLVFLYNRSGELTKDRLDFVKSEKNTVLVYQNLACTNQLENLCENLKNKVMIALNIS